ncbi:MAG TPA: ATP-binding cassette domain-containing protein [Ilumatobacter sp.]|nr:ATP-binding cassette domain-containing protein [Ilumatobacter sp.]
MTDRSSDRLAVEGLTQTFGERRALSDVSFEVLPGRVTGLLGPNGAGKTTLMRILFGVVQPDAGSLSWRGQPVTRAERSAWGYMPQERGLYTEMRVLDHLVWLARLHGVDTASARVTAVDLLERLDLAERKDDRIRELSGGMAQRVQLAAAMVHRPDLLVLDEPFSGLDPTAVVFLSDVIRGHVAEGRALLFSSHQLDLVEELCETIVMLDHGHVVLEGDLAELRRASSERFLTVDTTLGADELGPGDGELASATPTGSRIRLAPGADAGAVLDRVRARHPLTTFAVESPRLSDMFLAALKGEA